MGGRAMFSRIVVRYGSVEQRIRRRGDDVHLVAEARELARDVRQVYALSTGLHRPVVHEKADADC